MPYSITVYLIAEWQLNYTCLLSLQLLQLASSTVVISQATASNGRSCSELFPVLLMDDDDDEVRKLSTRW